MMRTKHVRANEPRFREPEVGEAIVVSKYGDVRRNAVILHPDDYDLLARLVEERLEQLTDPGTRGAQPFGGSERA